ncbi:MAG: dihydrodipicolinate synthase family protein [Rhizobacter sp.]|nr:dihydrodipicolinate synthase family protein [Rhizobacter sp.]
MEASDVDAAMELLHRGTAIPAHPLALDANRELDVRRQRALTRYYVDSGVGGLAVGVHTTQFAIRERGLYETVLSLAAETAFEMTAPRSMTTSNEPPKGSRPAWGGPAHGLPAQPALGRDSAGRPLVMVSGVCGNTPQALNEARISRRLGYHAGLISLAALGGRSEDELIAHCQAVADEVPLIGFYLQPAVGGLDLPASFWARFAAIDNVVAIKVAPFNRYRTLDVVRGVVQARAEERVTLYTGNDDHIVLDLLQPFTVMRDGAPVTVRFKGGLLGHWSVWTSRAVGLLERCQAAVASGGGVPADLLALDSRVTDCNAAFFDVANHFRGCIAGCHEVLRRQGLLEGIWCLDPEEGLSPGQADEIDRVLAQHADLADDDFVTANLSRWLDGR